MKSPDRESPMQQQQQQIRRYQSHPSAFLQKVFDLREGVSQRFQAIHNGLPMSCRNEILDSDTFQFPRAIVFSELEFVDHGPQLLSDNLLLGPAAEHPIGTAVVTTTCAVLLLFYMRMSGTMTLILSKSKPLPILECLLWDYIDRTL